MEVQHMRRFPAKTAGTPRPQTPRHCWAFEICDAVVLELLRVMRSDISEIRTDIRDVKARIGSIESYIATLHGDQARAALSPGSPDGLSRQDPRPRKRWQNCRFL